jgi:hypothetical protein
MRLLSEVYLFLPLIFSIFTGIIDPDNLASNIQSHVKPNLLHLAIDPEILAAQEDNPCHFQECHPGGSQASSLVVKV